MFATAMTEVTCRKVAARAAAMSRARTRRLRRGRGERFPPKRAQAVARSVAIGRGRARPPVFPPTMPNGAFVKVSSFTGDAGAARRTQTLVHRRARSLRKSQARQCGQSPASREAKVDERRSEDTLSYSVCR